MKKQLGTLCVLLFPMLGYGNSMQGDNNQYQYRYGEEHSTERVDDQNREEIGMRSQELRRSPEGRRAFLRGPEELREYRRQNRVPSGRTVNDSNQNPDRSNSPRSNQR